MRTRKRGIQLCSLGYLLAVLTAAATIGFVSDASAKGPLEYHGGPVLIRPSTTYFIYWQGSSGMLPATYIPDMAQFIRDWSGSLPHQVLTQYYQNAGSREYVANSIRYGGMTVDNSGFPRASLTDRELAREVRSVVKGRHLPEGYSATYVVILPEAEQTDFKCAWHNRVVDPDTSENIFYAIIPYYLGSHTCPMPGGPYPHGEAVDSAIDLLSHELSEIATDPWNTEDPTARRPTRTGTSWYTGSGRNEAEIGDLCRRNGHGVYAQRNGSGADVLLKGHPYLLQEEWSNILSGCTLGYVRIPDGYHDCHKAPAGTQDLFVSHMSCIRAIALLSPPLGSGAPRPRSFTPLGFNCVRLGRTLRYFYGFRWDLVTCRRGHGKGGFAYIHYPAAQY